MLRSCLLICILVATVTLTTSVAATPSSSYRAAVVQFHTQHVNGPDGKIRDPLSSIVMNLNRMNNHVINAVSQGAEIVVFPELAAGRAEINRVECTKYSIVVPDPMKASEPLIPIAMPSEWQNENIALTLMSKIAEENNVVIVIGFVEREPSSVTNSTADHIYNSAIVLDSDGSVLQVYRKSHLFSEKLTGAFDRAVPPEQRTFTTRFGVTFGIFICFEVLFEDPTIELIKQGITHFVYPTSWVNTPPFQSANQIQQGFSRTFNVTFLAANNAAGITKSGSGIYQNGEPLAYYFDPDKSEVANEKVIIADIPINNSNAIVPQKVAALSPPKFYSNSSSLEPLFGYDLFYPHPGQNGTLHATFEDLTCSATYKIAPVEYGNVWSAPERYALVAAHRWIWFGQPMHIEFCSIAKCVENYACVILDPISENVYGTNVKFESATLVANYPTDAVVYPLFATNNGQLVSPSSVIVNDEISSAPGNVIKTISFDSSNANHQPISLLNLGFFRAGFPDSGDTPTTKPPRK